MNLFYQLEQNHIISNEGEFQMNLRHLWNDLSNVLVNRLEPRIIEKHDRCGQSYYEVYDPTSQKFSSLNSEKEVRAWLDQRY
ncbi:hypothetical protein C7B65_14180 [Phormidesmis priestleyi ULC007]|uniref:Uncharacterized protein n=2 Tax=Phormidesmis priestleyi TaxID=268141 RepID=A0A2T1DE07_9CYAN|nr:hypothetical protein C7B65_14180 [Phormidesmis priestleyi ULC007]PZO51568.1 MAG: hypothetical protein DCF14_08690 [Phormidesmis priestleyi]